MNNSNSTDISVSEKTKTTLKLPPKYKVILMNDDFTTMEFVVFILKSVFAKTDEESFQIMLSIHQNGSEVVGTYSKEIATTKVALCLATAKSYQFPLNCTYEPVDE